MAILKTSKEELENIDDELLNTIAPAIDATFDLWKEGFANANGNIVTNGWLQSLYDQPEANMNKAYASANIVVGVTSASIVVGGAYIGAAAAGTAVTATAVCACIPVVGWIALIIAGILILIGICWLCATSNDQNFIYKSRDAVIKILDECSRNDNICYRYLENIENKVDNFDLSLKKMILLVDDFNQNNKDLSASASANSVTIDISAEDKATVLGITSTFKVGDEEVTRTAAEGMNAFYTYLETVMNAEVMAGYLESLGYDVDYSKIILNANGFVSDTLKSGLYTSSFVKYILPDHFPKNKDAAVQAMADDPELLLNKTEILAAIGQNTDLSGADLVTGGAALLGLKMFTNALTKETGAEPGKPPSGGEDPDDGKRPGGTTPGPDDGKKPGNDDGKKPGDDDGKKPGDDDGKKPGDDDKKPVNDVKIPELEDDTKLPEEVKPVIPVDYDQKAREEYEFGQDFDAIMEQRMRLIEEVDARYDNGDMQGLQEQLMKFGYSSAEAGAILGSKFLTEKAILEGAQRAELAARAEALAKADGVEDFVSQYSARPNYDDLTEEGASKELTLTSGDKRVTDAYDKMKETRDEYTGKVKEANDALLDVNENKKAVEEIRAKYEEKYGEDTSQWSEEAANEYKTAIEKYNNSVKTANEKLEAAEQAQKAYETANGEFEKAKENFLNNGYEGTEGNTGSGHTPSNGQEGGTGFNENGIPFGEEPEGDLEGVVVDGQDLSGTPVTPAPMVGGVDQTMMAQAGIASTTDQILASLNIDGDKLNIN